MSVESILRFAQLGLSAPVLQAVESVGYEVPSPIQAESIPPLLAGRDLVGQAQTGTGKTAAFALPMLSKIDLFCRHPQGLVITPTRELAIQVAEAIQTYARHLPGFHVLPVYGGQHIQAQLRPLHRGVHVVVGTPGRIIDHLDRGTLDFSQLRCVVLDEADEMLRMGFIEDVDKILDSTPPDAQRALFSATLPPAVRSIVNRHVKDPVHIHIESATTTVPAVRQRYCIAGGLDAKLDALTRILEATDYDGMLVFVRTKTITLELSERLEARGHASAPLNGDLNQALRERTIQRLKKGVLDIVVATDVAARGLDVDRISHVINFDIPNDTEAYVHRIGRTGRAGREGEAILFVAPREKRLLRSIERATGQPIEQLRLPSNAAIAERRVSRFKQLILETIEETDLAFFEDVIRKLVEEDGVEPLHAAAALAFLSQKERPIVPEPQPERPAYARHDARDRDDRRPDRGPRPERVARSDRPERPERSDGAPERPRPRSTEFGMQCFRLAVGRADGVQPKNIVGAICNETGLDGRDIQKIDIHERFTLVDLPEGMPREVQSHLKKIVVCGRPLQVSVYNEHANPDRVAPYPAKGAHAAKRNGAAARPEERRERSGSGGPRSGATPGGKFSGKPGAKFGGKGGPKFGGKPGKPSKGKLKGKAKAKAANKNKGKQKSFKKHKAR